MNTKEFDVNDPILGSDEQKVWGPKFQLQVGSRKSELDYISRWSDPLLSTERDRRQRNIFRRKSTGKF